MLGVSQNELKCVFAGREFDACFRLTSSKMEVRLILWNWLIGIEGFIHIDQQMVMSAVRKIIAGVSYSHVPEAETAPECTLDHGAILRPHEIKKGVFWCWLALSQRGE